MDEKNLIPDDFQVQDLVEQVVEKVNVEEKNIEELKKSIGEDGLKSFEGMDQKKVREEMLLMHQKKKEEEERKEEKRRRKEEARRVLEE